jgi:hypothetical protein
LFNIQILFLSLSIVLNTNEIFAAGHWTTNNSWKIAQLALNNNHSLVEQELLTLLEHPSSPPVFSGVHVTQSLVLCLCFVDCCLSFVLWPLCCLFFFDLWILITPLVSSHSSHSLCPETMWAYYVSPSNEGRHIVLVWFFLLLPLLLSEACPDHNFFVFRDRSMIFGMWVHDHKAVCRVP